MSGDQLDLDDEQREACMDCRYADFGAPCVMCGRRASS